MTETCVTNCTEGEYFNEGFLDTKRRALFLIPLLIILILGCATPNIGHLYSHPYDKVWQASLKTAYNIPTWMVVSANKESGLIVAEKPHGGTKSVLSKMVIYIQTANSSQTRVTMKSVSEGIMMFFVMDLDKRNIARFFKELDQSLEESKLQE